MLLLIIFSLLLFFSVLECAREAKYNNELENILKNYVKPLKLLTANLPNHEVEIQIEYQKLKEVKPSGLSTQKHVYVYNPLKLNTDSNLSLLPQRRYNDEHLVSSARRAGAAPAATSPKEPVDMTTATPVVTTTTTPTTLAPTSSSAVSPTLPPAANAGKKPIYLEDLKEILDDFVKKIQGANTAPPKKAVDQPIVVSNNGPVHGNQPYIEAIVNLLKQGLQVAKRIHVPTDEDLDWLQIKLPKNV